MRWFVKRGHKIRHHGQQRGTAASFTLFLKHLAHGMCEVFNICVVIPQRNANQQSGLHCTKH